MSERKRGRGRPAGGQYTVKRVVYLDDETAALLDKGTEKRKVSQSAAVRMAIRTWAEAEGVRLEE